MPRTAFVTGAAETAAAAAAVLAQRGWQVVGSGPEARTIECYVQMPFKVDEVGGGPGAAADGLAARVDLLAGIAPWLDDGATVLLAVDDQDSAGGLSPGLLEAIARVVLEDAGHFDARVAVLPTTDLTGATTASGANLSL